MSNSNPNTQQDKNQQQQGGGEGQQQGGTDDNRRQSGGSNPNTGRDNSGGASRQDVSNDPKRGVDDERSSDRI